MIRWLRALFGRKTESKVDERIDRLERRDARVRAEAKQAIQRAERVLSTDSANRAQRVVRQHR